MRFKGRKTYFIRKDLQSSFILRFVAAATVWAVAAVALFTYLAGRRLDDLRYSSHIDIQTTQELLLPVTAVALAGSLVLFSAILIYTVRSLWRRLSPPLSALKRSIARIAGGDLTGPIVLRKDDEFQYLASDLEEMRRGLQERIVGLKERQRELSAAAGELAASIEQGARPLSQAAALQSAVRRMQEELQTFHLEPEGSPDATCTVPPAR